MGWSWGGAVGGGVGGAQAGSGFGPYGPIIGGALGFLGGGLFGSKGKKGKSKSETTVTRQATPITVMIGGKPVTMYSYGPEQRKTTEEAEGPAPTGLEILGDVIAMGGAMKKMAAETGSLDSIKGTGATSSLENTPGPWRGGYNFPEEQQGDSLAYLSSYLTGRRG